MLNPFKLIAIYGDLNKVASQAKEMTMQNWKTTLCGVGAAVLLAVGNYSGANTWQGYAAAIAVALLGALAKDFNVKLSQDELASIAKAIGGLKMLLLAAMLGSALLLSAQTTTTGATGTTATTSSNGISAAAGPVAIQYQGAWSAATLSKQLFDFKDGATVGNQYHLYLGSYQLLAPTPNVQLYGGLIGYEPDVSRLFKSTNVPAGTFGLFLSGGAGIATLPTTTNVSWLAGGGVKYRATSTLSWNIAEVYYTRVGSQNVPVISSNLSFLFGGGSK